MGSLLAWIGLTMIVALPELVALPANWTFIGAVVMIIGVLVMTFTYLKK